MPCTPDENADVLVLCEKVRVELPELAPAIVDAIRRELPDFHVIEYSEQIRGVTEQGQALLAGLANRRLPSAQDCEQARDLGRRRARSGLPLEVLISAYHVGVRELWNILLTRAEAGGEPLRAQLVQAVGPVWKWIQEATNSAAEAYGETVRAEEATQYALTYRFLEVLHAGVPDRTDDAAQLALALGFDPAGEFQVVCVPGAAWPDERLGELRKHMRGRTGTMRCATRGATMIAVIQGMDPCPLITAIRDTGCRIPVGVGVARPGLAGAAASIADAQLVLPLAARSGDVVFFSRQWLLATLLPQAHRLAPLLGHIVLPAAAHPELARTVEGFARSGMSLTAAGRALHLNPNTVKYRLRRWQELTGWDPRTWDGLAASVLALGMFAARTADGADGAAPA